MKISSASVSTAHASRYLQQLAKHWGHKFQVDFTPTDATIELPLGRCALHAGSERLDVRLTGEDDTDFARFETVVAEHLQRFGHRETLQFDWSRQTV
jgi:hypothetical protein